MPDASAALVYAFRREDCMEDNLQVLMVGLDETRDYVVEDRDDGSVQNLSGAELMSQSLTVTFTNQRQARLYVLSAHEI